MDEIPGRDRPQRWEGQDRRRPVLRALRLRDLQQRDAFRSLGLLYHLARALGAGQPMPYGAGRAERMGVEVVQAGGQDVHQPVLLTAGALTVGLDCLVRLVGVRTGPGGLGSSALGGFPAHMLVQVAFAQPGRHHDQDRPVGTGPLRNEVLVDGKFGVQTREWLSPPVEFQVEGTRRTSPELPAVMRSQTP